jgi:hypothetical protein
MVEPEDINHLMTYSPENKNKIKDAARKTSISKSNSNSHSSGFAFQKRANTDLAVFGDDHG